MNQDISDEILISDNLFAIQELLTLFLKYFQENFFSLFGSGILIFLMALFSIFLLLYKETKYQEIKDTRGDKGKKSFHHLISEEFVLDLDEKVERLIDSYLTQVEMLSHPIITK